MAALTPIAHELGEALLAEVRASGTPGAWLSRALESDPRSVPFRAAYASVARRLGPGGLEPALPPERPDTSLRPHWSKVDLLRLLLLHHALDCVPSSDQAQAVHALFEGGEIGEQESLLRTLSLLPEPERFLGTALLACRTNTTRVLSAIACENPYPALHFPEKSFNQMVLKAIFMEVSVEHIEGLFQRITPDLRRMTSDFQSERRAAGRPIPADTVLILGSKAP